MNTKVSKKQITVTSFKYNEGAHRVTVEFSKPCGTDTIETLAAGDIINFLRDDMKLPGNQSDVFHATTGTEKHITTMKLELFLRDRETKKEIAQMASENQYNYLFTEMSNHGDISYIPNHARR